MHFYLKLLFFIAVANGLQAHIFDSDFEVSLHQHVEDLIQCHNIPGLTLAVVKGTETWSRGFGMTNIDTHQKVTNQSVFAIASLSKAFTSTLLAKLLGENTKGLLWELDSLPAPQWDYDEQKFFGSLRLARGCYNWNTKLRDILGPDYRFFTDSLTEDITLKDILAHRTGLAQWIIVLGVTAGIPRNISRADYCRRIKFVPPAQPFRDEFLYNDGMYMLAGHVAEVLAGDSWENLVQEHLFDPIGMSSTRILRSPDDMSKEDVARPFIIKGDGNFLNGTKELYTIWPGEPAGAVLSSADDMAKWMKFHLRQGVTDDNRTLVKRDVLAAIYNVHIHRPAASAMRKPYFPAEYVMEGYGFGWFVSSYRGYSVLSHSGGINSYISDVWLFPDLNIGIFVSTSGPFSSYQSTTTRGLFFYIADTLLNFDPWFNITSSCSTEPQVNATEMGNVHNQTGATVAFNADEYIGSYGTYLMPDIRVHKINNNALIFTMGKLKGELRPRENRDDFTFMITDPWEFPGKGNVTFQRSKGGPVNRLYLFLDAPVMFTKGLTFTDNVPISDQSVLEPLKCGGRSIAGNFYVISALYIFLFSQKFSE